MPGRGRSLWRVRDTSVSLPDGRTWPPARDGCDEAESALMRLGDEDAAVAWCGERCGTDGSRWFEGGDIEMAPADLALLAIEVPRLAAGLVPAG